MAEQRQHETEGYRPGRTLSDGERVVLARLNNQDTLPGGVASLELTITDRQAGVAMGLAPETDTCRRTRRPGYVLVLAQVMWQGQRFAQDRTHGGFREVDGVDGNFQAQGRTLPPEVTAGVLATIRQRYPSGGAIEVSWEQHDGRRCYTAFLLPQVRLPQ